MVPSDQYPCLAVASLGHDELTENIGLWMEPLKALKDNFTLWDVDTWQYGY